MTRIGIEISTNYNKLQIDVRPFRYKGGSKLKLFQINEPPLSLSLFLSLASIYIRGDIRLLLINDARKGEGRVKRVAGRRQD